MVRRTSQNSKPNGKKGLILGICLSGIFAGIGLFLMTKQQASAVSSETVIVAEYDTVALPVPSMPVIAGTKIEDIILEKIKFPTHQIPANAITDIRFLRGQVAVSNLPAKLPLFKENFAFYAGLKNPVIEKIPEGMRAMTIKVDATSAVEGWAGSGSSVDVLLVEKSKTTVIAEDVKILSAERSVAPVEGRSSPNIPSTVTLLVSQNQCLAINTAIPRGKIAFALRNFSDSHSWNNKVFTADQLSRNRAIAKKEADVSGYIEVEGNKFILSDGKWIKAPQKPQGFFAGS